MVAADRLAEQKRMDLEHKYGGLKKSYEQLLKSFDQSEELRKIYKQIVVDQRNEIKNMKGRIQIENMSGGRIDGTGSSINATNSPDEKTAGMWMEPSSTL